MKIQKNQSGLTNQILFSQEIILVLQKKAEVDQAAQFLKN